MVVASTESSPPRLRPTKAMLLLTLAFAVVFPAFAYFAHSAHGQDGVLAAGVAAVVCWGAGLCAIIVLSVFKEPQQVVTAVGLAMLIRMGIPLALGIFITKAGGPLAEAGVFGMMVGFYLVGLVIETILAVRLTAQHKHEQTSKAV